MKALIEFQQREYVDLITSWWN